jgi:hypothetical protein
MAQPTRTTKRSITSDKIHVHYIDSDTEVSIGLRPLDPFPNPLSINGFARPGRPGDKQMIIGITHRYSRLETRIAGQRLDKRTHPFQ